MLSENMLEQEVICSHFFNRRLYKYEEVLGTAATIQKELLKK
jgi:hypothetical protein